MGVSLEKGVSTSGHLSVIGGLQQPVYTVFENHTTRVLGGRIGGDFVVPGHLFMMVIQLARLFIGNSLVIKQNHAQITVT